MKKYKVSIIFDVYETSYNEGELKYVNLWDYNCEITVDTPIQAIECAFDNLGLSFNSDFADIDEDKLYYSNLVDADNEEVTEENSLYKDFQDGKINLYSLDAIVTVEELVLVSL